jgi:gliding motility-associated-like protein
MRAMLNLREYFNAISMKKYRLFSRFVLSLLVVGLLTNVAKAQSPRTSYGQDFWFAFTPTEDLLNAKYVVYITSFTNTTGTISIPLAAWSTSFSVNANDTVRIVVPANLAVQSAGFGAAANMGIHITTNANVSVLASIEITFRCESTEVLPVSILGNQYSVMNYKHMNVFGFGNPNYGTYSFLVVAQGCRDSVEITPTQNITLGGNHPAGVPFNVVLQPGQVYLVQSDSDLTGTLVQSLNHSETGVFAGSFFTSVQCSGTGNPFYEELFPVNTWGEDYVFLPTPNAQDQCRVLAAQNGTTVSFVSSSGTNTINLSAGHHYDTSVIYSSPVYITSNNPVSVARFLRTGDAGGGTCNNYMGTNPNLMGDPSEVMVQSNQQMMLDSISFVIDSLPDMDDTGFVEIITRTPDVNTVTFDGTNIGSDFVPFGPNTNYSYATLRIAYGPNAPGFGQHKILTTGQGVLAYYTNLGYIDATANDAGVYLREIIVTASSTPDGNCSGSPTGTATANASGIPPFTYAWSNGQTTQTATGLSAGSYTVTVSDEDCVPHWDTAIVQINSTVGIGVTATLTPIDPSCGSKGSIMATPTSGNAPYIYLWSNGTTSQNDTGLVAGTYYCKVTDSSGCYVTDTLVLVSSSTLSATLTPTNPACGIKGSIIATANNGSAPYTYLWNNGTTSQNDTGLIAGTYYCKVSDNSGCSVTDTVILVNSTNLTLTVCCSDTIKAGDTVQLSVTGAQNYIWNADTTLSCITCSNPLAFPKVTTTYTVTGSDTTGCQGTQEVTIYILDSSATCKEFVPNAFSPNNDNVNDYFGPTGLCIVSYSMHIFDRWGNLVYANSNSQPWDGTYNSHIAEEDVYIYQINVVDSDQIPRTYVGKVMLLK